jgi:predicted DNA-binding transcriptional regulator YafY
MRVARIHRLIRLIQTMQSGRAADPDSLAALLGVARRTLFRDLKTLEAAGVPYRFSKKTQRYFIDKSYFLPPLNLTVDEALALTLVTRKVMHRRMVPAHRSAVSAATKIESVLPHKIREHCGELLDGVDVRLWPLSDVEGVTDVLHTLRQSQTARKRVRIRYDSFFERRVIETILCPYRVVFLGRAWYVIGYSDAHDEVRTFKVERIESIRTLEESYKIDRGFDLDDYLGNAWQMIRGGPRYHVAVRFLPKVAGNVEEVAWHKTQQTTRHKDGSLVFEVDVDGLEEIAWWVLGYGDQAIVLEPPELREKIAAHARGMLKSYDGRTRR